MTSAENLEWLKEGKRKYVIGTPKAELKKWGQELVERNGWKQIRDNIEVQLCDGPDEAETSGTEAAATTQVPSHSARDVVPIPGYLTT